MRSVRTYILVANEVEARMLENDGIGEGVHQFSHITVDESGVLHHEFAAKPVSTQAAHGPTAGVEPRTSLREVNRHAFAEYLTELVEAAFSTKDYDRLIVVAGPKMLGELRDTLAGKAEVYAELGENLVNTPTNEIAKHLEGILAV